MTIAAEAYTLRAKLADGTGVRSVDGTEAFNIRRVLQHKHIIGHGGGEASNTHVSENF